MINQSNAGRFNPKVFVNCVQDKGVRLNLSVYKLLPQHKCDQCETQDYYGALHWGGHKGVDRRQIASLTKSATHFPSFTEKDTTFLGIYGWHIPDSGYLKFQKGAPYLKRFFCTAM